MTIKYANGWWGIYGADPFHIPKFKKFIDAIRWAKEHRGLEVPRIETYDYQTTFPNRAHIRAPRELLSNTFDLFVGVGIIEGDEYDTLDKALTAAHRFAANTR